MHLFTLRLGSFLLLSPTRLEKKVMVGFASYNKDGYTDKHIYIIVIIREKELISLRRGHGRGLQDDSLESWRDK